MPIRCLLVAALALAACGGESANRDPGGDPDAGDRDGTDELGAADGDGELPGDDLGDPVPGDGPFTALRRQINTSCDLSGPTATPVFAGLSPFQLTFMAPVPGVAGYLVISEQRGRILVFPRTGYAPGDEHEVLDLTDRVFNNDEKGFHSFAFAPDFGSGGGYLYVMYSIDAPGAPNDQDSRVERYTCTRDAVLTCDRDSGRTVIEIERPDGRGNHNGGQIFFDTAGYLYITMGDSGGGGDPDDWAQDLSRLQGKILRIDPASDSGGLHYTVPADNPFVGVAGAAPEIWAFGLRNPWRASYDAPSGRIFLADVGQDAWEEIDLIEPGNNYGWNLREGTHQYYGTCPTCTDPIHEYEHTLGRVAITGGFVYRGGQIGSLFGAYVFADYLTGEVFRLDEGMGGVWTASRIMTTGAPVTSFGQDDLGELYALHNDGTIHRIELDATDSAPPTLTATGCYSDVAGRVPIAAAVPYDLRVPFWSDGAEKKRYFILPGTSTIDASASSAWTFPVGTILIKEFELQEVAGDATSVRPIETRFLVQRAQGVWKGFSYQWNAGGTEATLRPDSELVGDYTLNGAPHRHVFPDRVACTTCHTPNGGFVLGLRTENVDRDRDYGAGPENQLAALELAGFFTAPIGAAPSLLSPLDEASASSGIRARSWLAVNCSHCHSGSANGGRMPDMRFATSLASSGLCDFIVPGSSGTSPLIIDRAGIRGPGQMPPLATLVPDDAAMEVLAAWIDAMDDVPPVLPAELVCP